ncbi:hypothetical protein C7271_14305 [filamentous cyanobacterium CCP5]|nr:hypothetical protein C7271_14305 [filamentous cyanobacterium CCP5]
MSKAVNYSLRTNPFYTYRDPETGHWVTVVPANDRIDQMAPTITARKLRLIDAEEYSQLQNPTP